MPATKHNQARQGDHRFPSYMPREEHEFLAWSGRLIENLLLYQDLFATDPGLIQRLRTTHGNLLLANQGIQSLNSDLAALVSYKNGLLYSLTQKPCPAFISVDCHFPGPGSTTGFIKTIKAEIARIKAHDNYSAAIGIAMGIENHDYPSRRKSELFPAFKLIDDFQHVNLRWKKGPAEAARILADHGDGQWRELATITRTRYQDPTPYPKERSIWRYKIHRLKKDKLIGYGSPAKSIVVQAQA
jgi:hypothetical protein